MSAQLLRYRPLRHLRLSARASVGVDLARISEELDQASDLEVDSQKDGQHTEAFPDIDHRAKHRI